MPHHARDHDVVLELADDEHDEAGARARRATTRSGRRRSRARPRRAARSPGRSRRCRRRRRAGARTAAPIAQNAERQHGRDEGDQQQLPADERAELSVDQLPGVADHASALPRDAARARAASPGRARRSSRRPWRRRRRRRRAISNALIPSETAPRKSPPADGRLLQPLLQPDEDLVLHAASSAWSSARSSAFDVGTPPIAWLIWSTAGGTTSQSRSASTAAIPR